MLRHLLLVVCLLAGCTAQDGEPAPAEVPGPQGPPGPELPAGFEKRVAITGGFDGAGQQVAGHCALQPWCFAYPVELTTPAAMQAELTWGLAASDFDLVLLKEGTEHAAAAARGPGPETIDMELPPGSYELVVVPYAVVHDEAELVVAFGPTGSS